MFQNVKRFRKWFVDFVDGKGFAVIVTACVAVITGTAIWAGSDHSAPVMPTPPVSGEQSAASLLQESLRNAATPTPLPTVSVILWQSPLPEISTLRGFSDTALVQSGVTGLWSLHEGIDLRAELGAPVTAIADGNVNASGEDVLDGVWAEITHPGGYSVRYAGLSMLAAIQPGDRVRAGQTIGFIGNGVIGESDLGPHLHLEISHDGKPVDPMTILE